MSPTVTSVIVCVAAAGFEGLMTGPGVRQRLGELRLPRYSPPLGLWIAVGLLYYILCFLLFRYLIGATFTLLHWGAIVLLVVLVVMNCLWNLFFFRLRSLRASLLVFIPYWGVAAAITGIFVFIYPFGAALLALYCLYLAYATWWTYRLWQLNEKSV